MTEIKPKRKKQNRSPDSPSAIKQKNNLYDVRKVGRPTITSLPPEEMIALGEEMLKWLKEHPGTVHLSEWYTVEKMFLYSEWKCFIQRKEFLPYYEKALSIIGLKYLKKSTVRDCVVNRWQRVYFKDLTDSEDTDLNRRDEKELLKKFKQIDYEQTKIGEREKQNMIPPNDKIVEIENENMLLKATIAELQQKINDNQRQTE